MLNRILFLHICSENSIVLSQKMNMGMALISMRHNSLLWFKLNLFHYNYNKKILEVFTPSDIFTNFSRQKTDWALLTLGLKNTTVASFTDASKYFVYPY